MDDTLSMLQELTEAPGVPGEEEAVRRVMRRYLEPVADIEADHLGSLVARKAGTAADPRVLIAGHMDEVGFMVTMITDEGYLRFQTLGGWWEQVMLAQRVTVRTRDGDVPGVIGSKPPHIMSAEDRKKVVQKKQMFIDIGAASKEEAMAFGVRPGDPVLPICPFTPMKNEQMLMAKAWDDRAGCGLVVETLRRIGEDHPNTLYGAGTVQEEVGLRGAATTGNMVEPDVAFALEVGIAGDTPGIKAEEVQSKLGQGPTLFLFDASMVPHVKLRNLVIATAEAEGIPHQFDAMPGGGTDAGRFHIVGKGAPSLVIGVPSRYIHSHASIIHRDDFDNAVRLLIAVIRKLDKATVAELRG